MLRQPSHKEYRQFTALGMLISIGMTMALCILFGLGGGWLIQKYWPKTAPWPLLIGIILGIVAGFKEMIRTLMRAVEETERANGD
jgi:F0F1-type ATP synthase assembly protein I